MEPDERVAWPEFEDFRHPSPSARIHASGPIDGLLDLQCEFVQAGADVEDRFTVDAAQQPHSRRNLAGHMRARQCVSEPLARLVQQWRVRGDRNRNHRRMLGAVRFGILDDRRQ